MRIRATFLLLAVAALVAGARADTASAATASLSIYSGCESNGVQYDYTLIVEGTTATYFGGYRVEYRLWGEDTWNDDLIVTHKHSYEDFGGLYHGFCVQSAWLDEDWGQDEVYVGVRVFGRPTGGALTETAETNRIRGSF